MPFLGAGVPESTLFPPPAPPIGTLLWLFVGYMAVGLLWLMLERIRRPRMILAITRAIESVVLQFAPSRGAVEGPAP